LTAGATAAYAAVEADRAAVLVLALGILSVTLLLLGLARGRSSAVLPALAGLGVAWTLAAWTRGAGAPGGTMLAAAGLLVAAELAYWSLEQIAVTDEPELVARRAAGLAVRAAVALALAAFLLAALELRAGGGLVLEAVGVAAAVGLLALVFALARETPR
jgi:hypothetical protein